MEIAKRAPGISSRHVDWFPLPKYGVPIFANEELEMSKLLTGLMAAGFSFGISAAIAQDVQSDQDKAKAEAQHMRQKEQEVGAAGQNQTTPSEPGEKHFQEGKPTQSEARQPNGGSPDEDQAQAQKQFEEGKPQQSDSGQAPQASPAYDQKGNQKQ